MANITVKGINTKSEAFESIEENDLALVGGGCGAGDVAQKASEWAGRAGTAIRSTINQIVNDPGSVADGLRATFPALFNG